MFTLINSLRQGLGSPGSSVVSVTDWLQMCDDPPASTFSFTVKLGFAHSIIDAFLKQVFVLVDVEEIQLQVSQ